MIQNLYLTLISQAAENGSNNSNFDINEQDKNCEFLHFNKPLSEVDSKQEESAFQNLNIINNQNYIQVT